MGIIILSILGIIAIFVVVILILKPQRTGSVKSIEASIKEGIKFRFYSPQPYLDGIPELPPDNLTRKGVDDGILAMDEYKWDEAIAIFRKPEAEGSQKVALLNLTGNCFYRQDNLGEALRHYKESLKLAEEIQDKEGRTINLNNIGIVYAKMGDYDSAIQYYTKAIELDPNYADAFYNRGIAYADKKDYDTAIQDYDKTIEIDPNHANAFNNRGLVYYYKKDYNTAIQDFNRTIEIDSNLADAFYNRGNAYDKKGDYDTAIRDYDKAIELDPSYVDAFNNRGIAYDEKGDYDSAICDYTKAIELDPNYAKAMANMGLACMKKGDKKSARIWWEKALAKKEYLPPDVEERVRRWIKELEE